MKKNARKMKNDDDDEKSRVQLTVGPGARDSEPCIAGGTLARLQADLGARFLADGLDVVPSPSNHSPDKIARDQNTQGKPVAALHFSLRFSFRIFFLLVLKPV